MKNTITIEEYTEKYGDIVTKSTEDETIIDEGMLKWDKYDNPEHWAGPFNGDYVHFKLRDYSGQKQKTIPELYEDTLNYIKYNKYNYPHSVLERLGMNEKHYFDVECYGQTCCRSELTDKELCEIMESRTKYEIIETDRKRAKSLLDPWSNPYNKVSAEQPYKLYLCGNDDCSYTCVKNKKDMDRIFGFVTKCPGWHYVKDNFFFSN